MGGTWTPNADVFKDKIVSLYKQGLSQQQIGMRLGCTKGVVAGVIFRMRKAGKAVAIPKAPGREERMQRASDMGRRLSKAGKLDRKPDHEKKRFAIPAPQEDDIARVTFAELEPHHCRFICCAEAGKAVAAGDKLYCGLQQVPGSSYCEGHLARVSPQATVLTEKRQAWLNGDRLGARFAPEAPEEMPA